MTPVRLPRYDVRDSVPLARAHRALVEEDQYDDWIPDVIHYRDHGQRADDSIAALERTWTGGEITVTPPSVFPLPRERSEPCPSIVLPFDHRVLAHSVIASMAGRVDRSILRDRVYGFGCFASRSSAGLLFSSPSDGITEVRDAAVASANLRHYLQLVDVRSFNASCRLDALSRTLRQCGARPEETLFIEALLPSASQGLPSIDDGFAYLYNFYLQPADASLAEARIPSCVTEICTSLSRKATRRGDNIRRLNLDPYEMADTPALRSFVIAEADLPRPDEIRDGSEPPDQTAPLLWLTLPTASIRITFDLDWTGEAELLDVRISHLESAADRAVQSVRDLFARWKATPDSLDAVALQPVMRSVHRARAAGVTELPPFAEASNEYNAYRRELMTGAELIRSRFRGALSSGEIWGASWLSVLLSDLGPLADDMAALVRQALSRNTASAGGVLASHLRLLLARCTTLSPDRFWADPAPEAGAFGQRAALLSAFYLARRGAPGIWSRIAPTAKAGEPLMVSFLEPYLRL